MCLDCKIQRSDLTSFVDVIDYDIFKLVLIFGHIAQVRIYLEFNFVFSILRYITHATLPGATKRHDVRQLC